MIYTITAIERIDWIVPEGGYPSYGVPWTIGWYDDLIAARYFINELAGLDVALRAYDWIVVEHVEEGVFGEHREREWYRRDSRGQFESVEEPSVLANVINFSMG